MPRPTGPDDYRVTVNIHDATREEYDALSVAEEHAPGDPVCRWKRIRLGSVHIAVFRVFRETSDAAETGGA